MRPKGKGLNPGGLPAWLGWPPDSAGKEASGRKAGGLPDYSVYRLTRGQFGRAAAVGCAMFFIAAYLFYHQPVVAVLFSAFGLIAPRIRRGSLLRQRRERLTLQFKEALNSLTSSLAAGRSVENAFIAALEDLRLLYPDGGTEILVEFEIIRARLGYGEPLEQALADLATRSGIDDIEQFVDVFSTCKRTGGDLVEVIRRTTQTIGEKLDIQQEIAVMVAQKRFESRIMMAVPFVFLAFLTFAAPDYIAPLYERSIGYVLLTVSLVLLCLCYWAITKITNIRT